jgi:hypothetical protein
MQQTGQRADQAAPDGAPGQRGPERRHEVEMPEHRRRALIRERHDQCHDGQQRDGQRDHGANIR